MFFGLHQDIMIYRARNKTVELVGARGIWPGLGCAAMQPFMDDSLYLRIGDVALLYTDGITQTWIRNAGRPRSSKPMFGQGRLRTLLEANGTDSIDDIMAAILPSLKGYEPDDDVTMMILKREE